MVRIRLSQKAKDQLVKLKRDTGLTNWNVLCRWALCTSLAEPSIPPESEHPADSNLEMDWNTFGGEYADVYWAVIKVRAKLDGTGVSDVDLARTVNLHIHRGIGYLATTGHIRSVAGLYSSAKWLELELRPD